MAAARAARSRRLAAAQVPVSIPALRRRSGRQSRDRRRRRGAAAVVTARRRAVVRACARGSRSRARRARSRKSRPFRRASIAPWFAINESFTYVLRAEGAVRGEPEVAPLAAQFDVLNTLEQPPHRHRQRARPARSTSGSSSSCRSRPASSRFRRCASAIGNRTPSPCACWRRIRTPPRRGRHLHGARAPSPTSSTRSRRCCSRCDCSSA